MVFIRSHCKSIGELRNNGAVLSRSEPIETAVAPLLKKQFAAADRRLVVDQLLRVGPAKDRYIAVKNRSIITQF